MQLDDITAAIIDTSIRIHRDLGPGLLESVYQSVLERALRRQELAIESQLPVSFEYEGVLYREAFRADLLVEQQVLVELKSVEALTYVHHKQVLTYLRLLKVPVGLLINFNGPTLKHGLRRIVNEMDPRASHLLRVNQKSHGNPD
jgi:GxxExxY protein